MQPLVGVWTPLPREHEGLRIYLGLEGQVSVLLARGLSRSKPCPALCEQTELPMILSNVLVGPEVSVAMLIEANQ